MVCFVSQVKKYWIVFTKTLDISLQFKNRPPWMDCQGLDLRQNKVERHNGWPYNTLTFDHCCWHYWCNRIATNVSINATSFNYCWWIIVFSKIHDRILKIVLKKGANSLQHYKFQYIWWGKSTQCLWIVFTHTNMSIACLYEFYPHVSLLTKVNLSPWLLNNLSNFAALQFPLDFFFVILDSCSPMKTNLIENLICNKLKSLSGH